MYTDHNGQKVVLISKVVIANGSDKILVLFRNESAPKRPLTWDLPGGLLEANESPKEAVMREVKEETGIKLNSVKILDVSYSIKGDGYDCPIITFIYTHRLESNTDEVKLSHEHNRYKWVAKDEFFRLKIPQKYKNAVEFIG